MKHLTSLYKLLMFHSSEAWDVQAALLSPPPVSICPPLCARQGLEAVAGGEDSPALPPLLLLLAVAALRRRQALVGGRRGGQVLRAAVHLQIQGK